MILCMSDSDGIKQLRQLAAKRAKLNADIDETAETVLRSGEYVENVAAALGVSRETIRRFRDKHQIPDARDIRQESGRPRRRPANP
jgi:hypothetical protein